MKTRQFIAQVDRQRIETAIRDAEAQTSGEIRVVIHHRPVEDAVAFARQEFSRLGMQATRERNAVLVLIAPESQQFAVIGDEGVHRKCGDVFWRELAEAMTLPFKQGDSLPACSPGSVAPARCSPPTSRAAPTTGTSCRTRWSRVRAWFQDRER